MFRLYVILVMQPARCPWATYSSYLRREVTAAVFRYNFILIQLFMWARIAAVTTPAGNSQFDTFRLETAMNCF